GRDRRHQDLRRAGAALLLAHDLLDLLQDAETERQPRINPRRGLADHAGAQHQPVRDDLCLARVLAQQRQEILGKAHATSRVPALPQSSNEPVAKIPPGIKKPPDPLRRFAYYPGTSKIHRQLAWPEFREVLA